MLGFIPKQNVLTLGTTKSSCIQGRSAIETLGVYHSAFPVVISSPAFHPSGSSQLQQEERGFPPTVAQRPSNRTSLHPVQLVTVLSLNQSFGLGNAAVRSDGEIGHHCSSVTWTTMTEFERAGASAITIEEISAEQACEHGPHRKVAPSHIVAASLCQVRRL